MPATENRELYGLLQKNAVLKKGGYSLAFDRDGRIIIDRAGHVHGIWNRDGQCFAWLSPGNSEPKFRTDDTNAAVLYTVAALSQD